MEPAAQMAVFRSLKSAWASAPFTRVCGTVARDGKALFHTAEASFKRDWPWAPLKHVIICASLSPVLVAHNLEADFAVPSFSSMQAKNWTRPAMSVWLKAHTVANSQLQLDSSMQGPPTVRTAGCSPKEVVVLKAAKTLRKSPDPKALHLVRINKELMDYTNE